MRVVAHEAAFAAVKDGAPPSGAFDAAIDTIEAALAWAVRSEEPEAPSQAVVQALEFAAAIRLAARPRGKETGE
jgi:hypothetical protein